MFINDFFHHDEDLSIFDLYYREASNKQPDSKPQALKLSSGRKSIIKESVLKIFIIFFEL